MRITHLETEVFALPLARPLTFSVAQDPQPISQIDVVTVRVHTDQGPTGLGFTYTQPGTGTLLARLIETSFTPLLKNEIATNTEWLFQRIRSAWDGLGFVGMVARAYAAVDIACWDLKGQIAKLPVYQLLGGYRHKLKAVAVDTATPVIGTRKAIEASLAALDAGAGGVQIEVGTLDPELDEERIKQFREAIPDGAWFEIHSAGRHDFSSAMWLGTIGAQDYGLDGFADPIPTTQKLDLKRLIDRLELGLSVGGLADRIEDLLPLIEQGGISSIRIDPFRLGGITPAQKLATIAEAHHIAITAVRVAEVGAHLGAAHMLGRICEYVDWLSPLFIGGPQFENGQLVLPNTPGLGLELNPANANSWRI